MNKKKPVFSKLPKWLKLLIAFLVVAGGAFGILPQNETTVPESAAVQQEASVETAADRTEAEEADREEASEAELEEAPEAELEKESEAASAEEKLTFRNQRLLQQHYEKHGKEMGFSSAEAYEQAAAAVVRNPEALHKTEKEDGDDVYYLEETNEFVIVSTDGYLRTYFHPGSGIAYFQRQ